MSIAETLQMLSIISYVVAGICLVLAIFFWIFFKIPVVIGDLSGRTARKSIAKMRATNEKTGVKGYKASKTNIEHGKLTDTIKDSGNLKNSKTSEDFDRPETGLLNENKADMPLAEETGILESETTGLLLEDEMTAPLVNIAESKKHRNNYKKLNMIEDVMLIHTDEVIR